MNHDAINLLVKDVKMTRLLPQALHFSHVMRTTLFSPI